MGYDKFYRKVVGTKADFTEQVVVKKGALTASATPFALVNPLGVDIIVEKVIIDVITLSTSTPVTIDIGCGASGAGISSDNLIDGAVISVGTSTPLALNSIDNKGTNGASSRKWLSTYYMNALCSGTPTGLTGNVYIYYRKA